MIMKHATLKIEKTKNADQCYGGIGGENYRVPAEYRVTGPNGRVYAVWASAYGFMQRPVWYYHCPDTKTGEGQFRSMGHCLKAIEEQTITDLQESKT